MRQDIAETRSTVASIVFDLLNPIPFGFFVGALVFDVVYANSPDAMWVKSAAWLISIALFVAVVPRLINLARVWLGHSGQGSTGSRVAFFLYLVGIIAAITNAFVHSRDAYAVVPEGVWLSAVTVGLLSAASIFDTLQVARNRPQVSA